MFWFKSLRSLNMGVGHWYDGCGNVPFCPSKCEFLLLGSNLNKSDSEITHRQPFTQPGMWIRESSKWFSVNYGSVRVIVTLPTWTSEKYWGRCNVSSLVCPSRYYQISQNLILVWRRVLIYLGVFLFTLWAWTQYTHLIHSDFLILTVLEEFIF